MAADRFLGGVACHPRALRRCRLPKTLPPISSRNFTNPQVPFPAWSPEEIDHQLVDADKRMSEPRGLCSPGFSDAMRRPDPGYGRADAEPAARVHVRARHAVKRGDTPSLVRRDRSATCTTTSIGRACSCTTRSRIVSSPSIHRRSLTPKPPVCRTTTSTSSGAGSSITAKNFARQHQSCC